jgi:hypothetical protein
MSLTLDDAQQYFLQVIMNKGVIDQLEFGDIFEKISKKFKLVYDDKGRKTFISDFIKRINKVIANFSMEIKFANCEITGMSFYCFIRQTDSSGIGQLSNLYSQTELKIFKKILVLIVQSEDGFIQRNSALNQIICDDEEVQTQVTKNVNAKDIRLAVEKFINDYWLFEIPSKKGMLTLHGRALSELSEYVGEIFGENTLNVCKLCEKMVLYGVSCDFCSIKLHHHCGKKYFEREKKCPNIRNCMQVFSEEKIKDFIEDLNQAKIAYMHESNASKD